MNRDRFQELADQFLNGDDWVSAYIDNDHLAEIIRELLEYIGEQFDAEDYMSNPSNRLWEELQAHLESENFDEFDWSAAVDALTEERRDHWVGLIDRAHVYGNEARQAVMNELVEELTNED